MSDDYEDVTDQICFDAVVSQRNEALAEIERLKSILKDTQETLYEISNQAGDPWCWPAAMCEKDYTILLPLIVKLADEAAEKIKTGLLNGENNE